MDDIERLLVERACSRLVVRFCELVDSYGHEELAGLWAEDAVWNTWKGPQHGRKAIRDYLDAKPKGAVGVHVVQNILIDVDDAGSASGNSVFSFYGGEPGAPEARTPRVLGRFRDRFKLTAEGWRFASRDTDIIYTA